jgi:hypothetical protein
VHRVTSPARCSIRRLDEDDIGPQFGKKATGDPGDIVGEVDDANPMQRQ